jgi:hypothetical protein
MSEAITAYTTTAAIRGAVGLTDSDLPDSVLVDQQLGLELEADLLVWLPDFETIYAAGMAGGATATEKLLAAYIQLYSQWFCAAQLVSLMTLGIPMLISDGKSELRRFPTLDLDALMLRVSSKKDAYKTLLQESQGQAAVTSTSVMQLSIPDYDPVTG